MENIKKYYINPPLEIITTNLNISKKYKQKCREASYKVGNLKNPYKGYNALFSTDYIWKETDTFNPLINKITNIANEVIPVKDPNYSYDLYNCWTVIYKKEDSIIPHVHLPSMLSFIYYIRATPNSSPLIFSESNLVIRPQDDLLVLFPSWARHEVPKQGSEEERIVLAGNYNFKYK